MQCVSQRPICLDDCTWCHSEIEVADITNSILTPGKLVLSLTPERQAHGRVATGVTCVTRPGQAGLDS